MYPTSRSGVSSCLGKRPSLKTARALLDEISVSSVCCETEEKLLGDILSSVLGWEARASTIVRWVQGVCGDTAKCTCGDGGKCAVCESGDGETNTLDDTGLLATLNDNPSAVRTHVCKHVRIVVPIVACCVLQVGHIMSAVYFEGKWCEVQSQVCPQLKMAIWDHRAHALLRAFLDTSAGNYKEYSFLMPPWVCLSAD